MAWYGMVWSSIALYCTIFTVLHFFALNHTALHCITLYSIVFCCIVKLHVEVKEGGVRIMLYQIING